MTAAQASDSTRFAFSPTLVGYLMGYAPDTAD